MPDDTVSADVLNKLSAALAQVSRGDPLVALRSEINTKLDTKLEAIDVHFAAIEKATELQHQDMVRVPTQVDRAVDSLRLLLEQTMKTEVSVVLGEIRRHIAETGEKFGKVDVMFSEGSKREKDLSVARDLALTNALNAAKEAVAEQNKANTAAINKSEISFSEQLKQIAATADQAYRSINEKIDDVKSRLDRGEGGHAGATEYRKDSRDNTSLIIAGLALLAAVALHFVK